MKKNYFIKAAVLVVTFFSLSISAQNSNKLWTGVNETKALQSEQVSRKISLTTEEFYQLDIEGIKTAVSLGLGAAFVSSSAIEKEIQLKTIGIIKIEKIKINRKLSIISNPQCYKSKAFDFFYTELIRLKNKIEN